VVSLLPLPGTRRLGGFDGSDLELISFETAKEGIKYKNRVILRKEQISSTGELERLQLEEEN